MDVRTAEIKLLACLVNQGEPRARLIRREAGVKLAYFLNPHVRTVARSLLGYVSLYGDIPPSRLDLVRQVQADNPGLAVVDVQNLDLVFDEVYGDKDPGHFDFYRDRVLDNWRHHGAAKGIDKALTALEERDYARLAGQLELIARGLAPETDKVVRLAPFGRDHRSLLDELAARRAAGPLAGEFIPTGLPWLDARFDGGWLRGENYMVIGHTGRGKSWFGTQAGYAAAEAGFKVVKFSLEMRARKDLYRLYARITGHPVNVFLRKPWLFDDEQWGRLERDVREWRERERVYEIRSWDTRPTMSGLRAELDRLDYLPDLVIVDQITDVANSLDWQDVAAVAFELQLLAKGFADERGVACLTFSQAKRGTLYNRHLTTEDSKYGGAPAEWCTAVLYLSQTEEEREDEVLSLGVCKDRDGEASDDLMTLYPDFSRGRLHCFEREQREGAVDDGLPAF